jgi:hypothetical protein
MEFILHSTFVLAEPLLVLCILCAWFVMVRALQNPDSQLLWGLAGGLVGLAYLTKETGQLVAGCFVLANLLSYGLRSVQQRTLWIFLAAYGLIALPLWAYNWKTFGSPTFNLAITHQMWMDEWNQNFVSDARALPTIWTYWRSHSWQEAWARAWKGLTDMRFFMAKMLWPTRSLAFDRFLLSEWSGMALVVMIGGGLITRHSVWAFFRRHREAVILTILISAVFYGLFSWYMAIVPIPTRFVLPLLPVWLLFVSASLIGIGRKIFTASKVPIWSKVAIGLGFLVFSLFVGRWFMLSGLANAQAFRQNPFDADKAFNSDSEQPLLWVRTGHSTDPDPVGVLVGPGNYLPTWRHSDVLRFVIYPLDIKTSEDLDVFLDARDVKYIIVDADVADRGGKAAEHLLGIREIIGDRVAFDMVPPGLALGFVYPEIPCKWCVFQRMAYKLPTYTTNLVLGDAILLLGYDAVATDFRPGGYFTVTLYWESLQPVVTDYTVFTQLLGPDWQLYGQMDRQPLYGQWPTSRWQPGQRFVDKFMIPVSKAAPAGEYVVLVGLYDLNTGQRLSVSKGEERVPDDAIALHHLAIGDKTDEQ